MPPLQKAAEEAICWIQSQKAGVEAEVYLVRAKERAVNFKSGNLETIQEAELSGTGLRLVKDGRQGFAHSNGTDIETVKHLFNTIIPQMTHLPQDRFRKLPTQPDCQPTPTGSLAESLRDRSLFKKPLEEHIPLLKDMEAYALAADRRVKSVLRMGYEESKAKVAIANTMGIRTRERGTSCTVGLAVSAQDSKDLQVGSALQSYRHFDKLDFKKVSQEAVMRAVSLLSSRKIPSRRRAIVIDPWVGGELMEIVSSALSAENVHRGKSMFKGKLGRKIAGELVTLIDDPHRPGGLASTICDDEGVPCRKKVMVEHGTLRDLFYDTYNAAKDKKISNGSAGRPSFKGIPSPSPSNFYLAPGNTTKEKIISETRDGILVLEVMGMHTANPVSGEFSVGISGIRIEKGNLTHSVREAMISGNMIDLLNQIDAVGNDLEFHSNVAAPTFRIASVMVA